MFEVEHMLAATMTTLAAGNPMAGMPDLDVQRMDARSIRVPARAGTE